MVTHGHSTSRAAPPQHFSTIRDRTMTQTLAHTEQSGRKTALVTGGGTGIGRSAALALAAEGYEVTVAGRTAGTLEQTVNLVTQAGGNAKFRIADVHDADAVRRAVQAAVSDS